ncbi:hypothetical protein [Kitasatospora sp. NPDC088134]|uniref:hypothetical protein n=1 Tax=Kitasatospora sp. NPDC088134 TaxID=3364071 RepID=UPI00381D7190
MQHTDIRLSRTDPVTGAREAADWGREFTEIDGVVLVVRHTYRAATRHQFWRAEAYTDHLDSAAYREWAQAGHAFGFVHVRRELLLRQIANLVDTEEWAAKRAAWLVVPREPRWWGTYRAISRGPRRWWLVPNSPSRDTELGPFPSRTAALAARP